MAYRKRVFFTDNQKAEIWDRWQRGDSMSSIGRVFDRGSSSIYPLLERAGGIRPAARTRSRLALTFNEREEISRGLVAQHSLRVIARKLHRAPSTISREVHRNGGTKQYRASVSDAKAWDRAHRPKPCKLVGNDYLCRMISTKLHRKWSPQQIADWLMHEHPEEDDKRTSHALPGRELRSNVREEDDLSELVHTNAWRSKEGIAGTFTRDSVYPALASRDFEAQRFGQNQRRCFYQRKACRC